jgi:hypothetical protein
MRSAEKRGMATQCTICVLRKPWTEYDAMHHFGRPRKSGSEYRV